MKKMSCLAIAASLMLLLQSAKPVATPSLLDYTWYEDQQRTSPTGTASDVYTELTRLRYLNPMYTFSASFTLGLHEFEWGYYPSSFIVIIYSNTP